MDDAQLAVALRMTDHIWSWTSFVPVDTPTGRLVAFAQLEGHDGWLSPLRREDRDALEGLNGGEFALRVRPTSRADWTASAVIRRGISGVPLAFELDVGEASFRRERSNERAYSRIVYSGIALPGYTNYVWLHEGERASSRHGYTPVSLFGRDVVISEISPYSDEPTQRYLGVTVAGEWFSQLELDALELTLYLLVGGAGMRQCVESFDIDARFISRSHHRLGHARETSANPIFPQQNYHEPEFYVRFAAIANSAKDLIEARLPLRAILFRVFSSQQPVPEVAITELAIALDAIKNAVVIKIKGEGKLMDQGVFDRRIVPVIEATKREFQSSEDSEALSLILRRILGANDWSDRERWRRFWRDHAHYQLTDRERDVLEHRDPAIHAGYILQTEYDLALQERPDVDRRPYEQRLQDLLADSKVFRNIVNRILLRLLGYRGELMDAAHLGSRLDTRRIVYLGWGSLIWNPRSLRLRTSDKPWHRDGPELPVEFARQSSGSRVTLVLTPEAKAVPVLWADSLLENIEAATTDLSDRESSRSRPGRVVDFWSETSASDSPYAELIAGWAREKKIDGVIWTKLPPKFCDQNGRIPTGDELIDYLAGLHDPTNAREYIQKAPAQISTQFRSIVGARLGWRSDEQTNGFIRY